MRAMRLQARDRQRIASLGGKARAASLLAARRIAENFRYVAALRELQGPETPAARSTTVDGRLPGVYPPRR